MSLFYDKNPNFFKKIGNVFGLLYNIKELE